MMVVTCISVGVYGDSLVRGQHYEAVQENEGKSQTRIRLDGGRLRWFPSGCFGVEGQVVPMLTKWQFDEEIESDEQSWLPDVSFTLSDGTRRWCGLATPYSLQQLLQDRIAEPYLWAANLVIVRSYTSAAVEEALRHLDEQGELVAASKLIETHDEVEET